MNHLKSVCRMLDRAAELACTIGTAFMVLVIVVQVFLRSLTRFSLPWAEELSRFLFVWVCFLGAGCLVWDRSMASITLLTERLSPSAGRAVSIAVNAAITCFALFAASSGIQLIGNLSGQTSGALGLPMVHVYLCVPLGCGLIALFSGYQVLEALLKRGEGL